MNSKECDFGIIGTFPLNSVNFEMEVDHTDEEIDNIINELMDKYNSNIDLMNKKLFVKLYNSCLWGVDNADIWNESYFNEIINRDKLPSNFDSLSDEEKTEVLFSKEIDLEDFNNADSVVKLFNLDKIKDYCRIYNVSIDEKYKELSIELNFLCGSNGTAFCSPLIEMSYESDFVIKRIDPGY